MITTVRGLLEKPHQQYLVRSKSKDKEKECQNQKHWDTRCKSHRTKEERKKHSLTLRSVKYWTTDHFIHLCLARKTVGALRFQRSKIHESSKREYDVILKIT